MHVCALEQFSSSESQCTTGLFGKTSLRSALKVVEKSRVIRRLLEGHFLHLHAANISAFFLGRSVAKGDTNESGAMLVKNEFELQAGGIVTNLLSPHQPRECPGVGPTGRQEAARLPAGGHRKRLSSSSSS